jgi:hypothetical protein
MYGECGVSSLIPHIDVVTKIDPTSVVNRRLDQRTSLPHRFGKDGINVGQITAFVVLCVDVL